jgi:hypothetical protein
LDVGVHGPADRKKLDQQLAGCYTDRQQQVPTENGREQPTRESDPSHEGFLSVIDSGNCGAKAGLFE